MGAAALHGSDETRFKSNEFWHFRGGLGHHGGATFTQASRCTPRSSS
jgi:hypothetical protein